MMFTINLENKQNYNQISNNKKQTLTKVHYIYLYAKLVIEDMLKWAWRGR